MRLVAFPLGCHENGPSDALGNQCAELIMEPGATRERLIQGVFAGNQGDGIAKLEHAFELVCGLEDVRERIRDAGFETVQQAYESGLITDEDRAELLRAQAAVQDAIAVDDFPAGAVSHALFDKPD
jgi:acyl-CoA dehydrogenase